MITVKNERDHVEVSIPTEDMSPDEVNEFVSWVRAESIARRSKLTIEAARQLSEDIKSAWWQANERRFTSGVLICTPLICPP